MCEAKFNVQVRIDMANFPDNDVSLFTTTYFGLSTRRNSGASDRTWASHQYTRPPAHQVDVSNQFRHPPRRQNEPPEQPHYNNSNHQLFDEDFTQPSMDISPMVSSIDDNEYQVVHTNYGDGEAADEQMDDFDDSDVYSGVEIDSPLINAVWPPEGHSIDPRATESRRYKRRGVYAHQRMTQRYSSTETRDDGKY